MKILIACGMALALLAGPSLAAEPRKPGEYPPTIDSIAQPGIAKGKLIGPLEFHSKIIDGNTVRRYWIYVPVGYDPKQPPNLLVFQDGQRAINPRSLNIPVVLDNLIAKGDIPKTHRHLHHAGQYRHRALSRQSGPGKSQSPRAGI